MNQPLKAGITVMTFYIAYLTAVRYYTKVERGSDKPPHWLEKINYMGQAIKREESALKT